MKKSKLFFSNQYRTVEKKIAALLNKQPEFLSSRTAQSTRAVGDAIENILVENFDGILGSFIKEYSSSFARRAMADLAFTDKDDLYYIVDVKTHRLDTGFNIPNLTSVERLARFYEDDNNYFSILKIDYAIQGSKAKIKKATFVPIEFLSWNCLTLGALGWGQIQIANSNRVTVLPRNSRKKWMLELCDNLFEFYPKEISKINSRLKHFKEVRKFWEKKQG